MADGGFFVALQIKIPSDAQKHFTVIFLDITA